MYAFRFFAYVACYEDTMLATLDLDPSFSLFPLALFGVSLEYGAGQYNTGNEYLLALG